MLIKDEIKNAIKELEEEKQLEKLENKKASKLRRKRILSGIVLGCIFVFIIGTLITLATLFILKADSILKVYPLRIYILLLTFVYIMIAAPVFVLGYRIGFNDMEDEDANNR